MKRTSIRIIGGFLLVITAGSLMLHSWGYNDGALETWIDTVFTVVSGVCVTGLTVIDISKELNPQGQGILLALIQVGGLGVLTLSNWLTLFIRGKMKFIQIDSTNKTLGSLAKLPPAVFIRRIFIFTFITEIVGATILALAFLPGHSFSEALWLGFFHSISAFCNAGFSLFSNNLEGYQDNFAVNATIMALIFLGGIGFIVIDDLYEYAKSLLKQKKYKLSLQSRLSLSASAFLVVTGAAYIYSLELHSSFRGDDILSGIMKSFFLSVTSRTAGFNTVSTGDLTSMTLTGVILLMMIGASSGSTGGGVKTSTAVVFFAMLKSNFRKRDDVEIFYRRISHTEVSRVITIILSYLVAMFIAVTLLQIVETAGQDPRSSRGLFLEHLFEVVSALSTVGLSTGVTPTLTVSGKIIIIACMFAGRVGLLALVTSVIGRQKKVLYKYPVENIMTG